MTVQDNITEPLSYIWDNQNNLKKIIIINGKEVRIYSTLLTYAIVHAYSIVNLPIEIFYHI